MISCSAWASPWSVELGRSGFMGTLSMGPQYHFNERHLAAFTVGSYMNGPAHYPQINLAYRYARWKYEASPLLWKPLHAGVFMLYSLDNKRYFLKSPSKYPSDGYYEQTALRGGLEIGTTVLFLRTRLAGSLYLRILDNGIVALVNNAHRDLQYYSSSGLGLQYYF